jgi:hypothetical protein
MSATQVKEAVFLRAAVIVRTEVHPGIVTLPLKR